MFIYIIIMSRTDIINIINNLSEEIINDTAKMKDYANNEEYGAFFQRSSYKELRKEIYKEIMDKKNNLNNLITDLLTVDKNISSNMNVLD